MSCQLKVVFLVIIIEDRRLVPATSAADSCYLVAVLRGDEVGAVAELEVLGLGEVLFQSLDSLGVAFGHILEEDAHATFRFDRSVGMKVNKGDCSFPHTGVICSHVSFLSQITRLTRFCVTQ